MERLERLNRNRPCIIINGIILMLALAMSPARGSAPSAEKDAEIEPGCCVNAPFETNVVEADLTMESWMTAPFETNVAEADLTMESWMTAPFETNVAEPELSVEAWMTGTF